MNWNSSILWGIVGLIGGGLISSFFYFIGKKRMILSYDIITTTLVSCNATKIKDLNIQYKEKPIYNLYTSTLKFKNIGNCIIEPSDFAPSAPLSLITDGEFLISEDTGTHIFTENDSNRVSPIMEINNNVCRKSTIQFDYIAKNETISCTVFHTGSVCISGKLKDGKLKNSDEKSRIPFILSTIIAIISSLTTIISFLYSYIVSH